MKALEAFNAGSLDDALELAKQDVKNNPTDINFRNLYCELLCWAGDLEKADKQLYIAEQQDAGNRIPFALSRQLIRAETTRQECFRQGRAPDVLHDMDQVGKLQLELMLVLRENNATRAQELITQIDEERPAISGTCDEQDFSDLRDQDDTCATFFEVLTSTGKYFWIPYSKVLSLTFDTIKTPRDLLWRPAHMIVNGGPDGHVYLPMNYAISLGSEDKQLQLGRATTWSDESAGAIQGQGRRMLFVGDGEKSLLDVEDFTFSGHEEAAPGAGNAETSADESTEA